MEKQDKDNIDKNSGNLSNLDPQREMGQQQDFEGKPLGDKPKKLSKKVISILAFSLACISILLICVSTPGRKIIGSILLNGEDSITVTNKDSQKQPVKTEEELEQERIKAEEEAQRLLELEKQKKKEEAIDAVLAHSDYLAKGYFYDEAIEAVKSYEGDYATIDRMMAAITRYEEQKKNLVEYEGPVSHVFFHSLIADNSKAFDGDRMENGYNYWMTTTSEFSKMMEQMYQNDFILVDIHDVAGYVEEDGKIRKKTLYLPAGKKPFVLSQDDVNYYEYMKSDGFAKRMLLDENGKVACELVTENGSIIARDYDVVPMLDVFLEEHPDFSYRGAKGIIALTGYEGALGYRTNDKDNPNLEKDKKTVKELAKALKADGWEFASHSYGHGHMSTFTTERFKADSNRWEDTVGSLVGATDIYIYPYGEEIDYKGESFKYLKSLGYNYFCGVYAKPWIEVSDNYVRMTRRNLDGFAMHFYPERLADLFDVDTVIDPERPEFKE